jgi:hypothetical protein
MSDREDEKVVVVVVAETVEAIEGASSMEPGLANSESVHSGK